jgi:hypothetical protein
MSRNVNLLQVLVLPNRVFQNRITNPFCRLIFVLTDHLLNLEPFVRQDIPSGFSGIAGDNQTPVDSRIIGL